MRRKASPRRQPSLTRSASVLLAACIAPREENALGMAPLRRNVPIQPHRPRAGKDALDLFLESLRADPEQGRLGVAAAAADLGYGALEVTIMAAERLLCGVEDERHVAVVTAFGVTALEAEDTRRKAASVEEEDGLAAIGEGLFDRFS